MEDTDANPATLALIDHLKLEPVRRQYHMLHYVNCSSAFARRIANPRDPTDVVSIQPTGNRANWTSGRTRSLRQFIGNAPSGPGYLAWLTNVVGFTQAQFDESGFVVDISDSGIDDGTTTPGHFTLYELAIPTNRAGCLQSIGRNAES